MFEFPKEKENAWINLYEMDVNSPNLFIPIINIDENEIKCWYETLNINLGNICPIYYEGKYKINIISYINEDLKIGIEDYKEEIIEEGNKKTKIENKEKLEIEEEPKEEQNIKNNEINHLNNIQYEEEKINIHELISVIEFIRKDEKKNTNFCWNSFFYWRRNYVIKMQIDN